MEMLVNMDHWRRLCPSTDLFHPNFFILVLFGVVWPAAGEFNEKPRMFRFLGPPCVLGQLFGSA